MDHIIASLEREEVARLSPAGSRVDRSFWPGDTVRLRLKIQEGDRSRLQAFEGVCIARSGGSINASFTLRKISFGEGVERTFPLYSPVIDTLEVVRRGHVRRAKLYYLRGRRGKAARIAEKATQWRRESLPEVERWGESGLRSGDGEAGASVSSMAALLKELKALKGAAEGPKVRTVLDRALLSLPAEPAKPGERSHAYETALTLGEHVCPLMFSHDQAVATAARAAIGRIGALIAGADAGRGDAAVATTLRHLQVTVIFHLSIRRAVGNADVSLAAQDILFAATERPGLDKEHPIHVQLLLEDVQEAQVESVGEAALGPRADKTVRFAVAGDGNELDRKLVTVMAEGQEIFRSTLRRDAEWLFVL